MSPASKMRDFNGVFNWSMSYRMDTDVPVPYGRTVALSKEEQLHYVHIDVAASKTKFLAAMGSNCGGHNSRWKYINQLSKIVAVDTYGHCGKLKCQGHYDKPCPLLKQYKFFLSFENSDCKEYITEKVWYNAYHNQAVPV